MLIRDFQSSAFIIRNVWLSKQNRLHILRQKFDVEIISVTNMPDYNGNKCYNIIGKHEMLSNIIWYGLVDSGAKIFELYEPENRKIHLNVTMKHEYFDLKLIDAKALNDILYDDIIEYDSIGWIRVDNITETETTFSHFSNRSNEEILRKIENTVRANWMNDIYV